jgi:hypothetical protein
MSSNFPLSKGTQSRGKPLRSLRNLCVLGVPASGAPMQGRKVRKEAQSTQRKFDSSLK